MEWTRRMCAATVGTGLLLSAITLGSTPARADDEPKTAAEARARVTQLEREQSRIEADYTAAQDRAKNARAAAGVKQTEVDDLTKQVDAKRAQVAAYGLAEYKQAGMPQAARMVSNPDRFLTNADVAAKYADNQQAALQGLQAKQGQLTEAQRAVTANLNSATAEEARMAELEKAAKDKMTQAKAVVDRLDAAEKAAYEAEQARKAAEEKAAREAAAAKVAAAQAAAAQAPAPAAPNAPTAPAPNAPAPSAPEQPAPTQPSAPAPAAPAPGGAAAQAVAFALSKTGADYAMGGTGPLYDCSGLVMMAYRSAGISLPRTSDAQIGAGRPVSLNALQPGDIIGYYGGSHVGIYVGDGMVMQAFDYGRQAGVAPLNGLGGPTSATRVA